MNDQVITIFGMVCNFVLGYWVSKNAKAGATIKKIIPVMNFGVALVTQFIAAGTAAVASIPAPAEPASMVMTAGFFGTVGKGLADVLYNALMQTLVVTGAHSTQKNARQALSGSK